MTNTHNIRKNRQLLKKLLSEALVASEADKWPGYKPKKPWKGAAANFEKFIKSIGGRPFPHPFGGSHSYEVSVGDDNIYLHEYGEAFSTNRSVSMYYGLDSKFSKNGLVLYKEPAKKTIEGAIEFNNGRITWKPIDPDTAKKQSEESWIDYVQYALTIIGFIPGYGDIADVINAIISFYRYESTGETMYAIDGFLNLIGAIPIVGSAVILPVKAVFKGLNKGSDYLVAMFKARKSADEVWAALRSEGTLDPKTLNALSDGMGTIASAVKSFRNKADWMLSSSAAQKLDDFADWLSLNSRSSREIFELSAKRGDDIVQGAGKFRGKGILKKLDDMPDWGTIGNIIPPKIRKKLAGIFTRALSPQELQKLRGLLDAKFVAKCNNPDVLTAVFKTMPKKMAMRTADGRVLTKAQDISGYLYTLSKTNPAQFKKIKTSIVDYAISKNNPLYKNFMNSEVNALKTFITNPGSFIGMGFNRFSNMVPIIWNELKDIGEDVLMSAGIETKDDINGLFWPMFKSAMTVTTYIPLGVGSASQKAQDYVSGTVGSGYETIANSAIGTVLGAPIKAVTGGVDAVKPYDPNVKFQIVPDKDPRLTKQKEKKKKDIEQRRSWF